MIVAGPTMAPLLASAAVPGIFPPVEVNGHRLVDGAVVNLVPISHALAGPTERIYVLDASDPIGDRPIRSPLDVAIRSFAISRDQRFALELAWVPPDIEVVVFPAPHDDREFIDFSGGATLVKEAYKLASETLDDHEADASARRRRGWWDVFRR